MTPSRLPFVLLACVAMFVLLTAAPAQARTREILPGQPVTLGTDEGLLVVAVDTDAELALMRIVPLRGTGAIRDARPFGKGRTYRMYALDAGRYRWFETQRENLPVPVRLSMDRDRFAFDIAAGVVNYPGDFIFRGIGPWSGRIHIANRSLPVLDWLQAEHPTVWARYGLEYRGLYPDPFPARYREALAATGEGTVAVRRDAGRAPPAPGALPVPIADLWKPTPLELMELSPDGRLTGEVVTFMKGEVKHWGVNLIDLETGESVRLFEAPKPIWRLDWVSTRDLVMSVGRDDEPDAVLVVNVSDGAEGRKYGLVVVPRLGLVVSMLPEEPGHMLFASRAPNGGMMVHKLDVRAQDALKAFKFRQRDRLDRGVRDAVVWYADGAGRLRMAERYNKDGDRVLMHGEGEDFREILNLGDAQSDFEPRMLSADGSRIYGIAEEGRTQRDLVEFDVAQGKVVRTVFSLPGVDVVGTLRNERGDLLGASYYRDGLLFSHYFEDRNATLIERLRRAFPDKATTIMQRDRDSRHFLVAVGGSDTPTKVYHFDAGASRASLVSETMPWLEAYRFAPTRTLRAKVDGFEIEAYLTLPAGDGKRPLVVFPHGGPIGVRDSRYFDAEVQLLASLGYAVLQVNFRGSEGFGTAFREAATGQYGAGIEDDIDAALKAALAAYPLDERRMCMLGSSYGGYSSLISAIRWPGRFRCAVSIAGLSDKVLFFTASDSVRSEPVRKEMEKKIGDPGKDLERLVRDSPLYRYRELTVPVMLVHGTEDYRADYEHTRRMVRMLDLAGRPPVLVTLDGEGHGIRETANIETAWKGIAGFLRTHLGDEVGAGTIAAPATPSAAPADGSAPASTP